MSSDSTGNVLNPAATPKFPSLPPIAALIAPPAIINAWLPLLSPFAFPTPAAKMSNNTILHQKLPTAKASFFESDGLTVPTMNIFNDDNDAVNNTAWNQSILFKPPIAPSVPPSTSNSNAGLFSGNGYQESPATFLPFK